MQRRPWTFWNYYGLSCLIVFMTIFVTISFITYTNGPAVVLADSVFPDAAKDVFPVRNLKLIQANPVVFDDDVSYGWSIDTWKSSAISSVQGAQGNALHITSSEAWGGVQFETRAPLASGTAVTLNVYAPTAPNALILEINDKKGKSLGRFPLFWYAPNHILATSTWTRVTIPIQHANTTFKNVGSISVVTSTTTDAYIDDVAFVSTELSWPRYVPPPDQYYVPLAITGSTTLPYTADFKKLWRSLYGKFIVTDDVRVGPILSETGSQGSMAVYTDGGSFTDYRATARLKWGTTESFGLVARFVDENNYVSCNYSELYSMVSMFAVRNGESTQLGDTPELARTSFYDRDILRENSIEVVGNKVSCFMDGERVLSITVPGISPRGTTGISTWTRYSDALPHVIKSFTVTEI